MLDYRKIKTFTLIEMLIVIVIIGILAAALVPRLTSLQSRARNSQRRVDVSQIATALRIHAFDYGGYPFYLNYLALSGIVTSLPQDPQVATNLDGRIDLDRYAAIALAFWHQRPARTGLFNPSRS